MTSFTEVPEPSDKYIDSVTKDNPDPLIRARMRGVRFLTAVACLKLCTNEGDKHAIRKEYGIPGPYEPCPICTDALDHHGNCYRDHNDDDDDPHMEGWVKGEWK